MLHSRDGRLSVCLFVHLLIVGRVDVRQYRETAANSHARGNELYKTTVTV